MSTVNTSLLWNGAKIEFFRPTHGIRQGDSLSPFLFVIYLEQLLIMIANTVANRIWTPFQLCRSGPCIPHLLFTDDLLLFTKATTSQAQRVPETVQNFCSIPGQSVNKAKTTFFIGPSLPYGITNQISHILAILCAILAFH